MPWEAPRHVLYASSALSLWASQGLHQNRVHSLSHTASLSNTLDTPVHVPIKLNREEGVK